MEKQLVTGNKLKITLGTFEESKKLYQAIMDECKAVKIEFTKEMNVDLMKNMLFTLMSSKKIEDALWVCMRRCTYNDEKITTDIFEDVNARADYFDVCFEVAKENVNPFLKSLYAQYGPTLKEIFGDLK